MNTFRKNNSLTICLIKIVIQYILLNLKQKYTCKVKTLQAGFLTAILARMII